jgi:hypothetical protein
LGIVLVKHVIASAKENGPVGIVHPVVGGKQVVLRTQRIGAEFAAEVSGGLVGV